MEATQEGHMDLVRFLLENQAGVHAQFQTGDTTLMYACIFGPDGKYLIGAIEGKSDEKGQHDAECKAESGEKSFR